MKEYYIFLQITVFWFALFLVLGFSFNITESSEYIWVLTCNENR